MYPKETPMIDLPDKEPDFGFLHEIILGSVRARLLLTGIEMKLFDYLCQPRSAGELARILGLHPENTRYFLDGLAACKLVSKQTEFYRNTNISRTFLVEDSPTYLGKMLEYSARTYEAGFADIASLLQNGPPENSCCTEKEFQAMNAHGAQMIENLQRAGFARMAVEIIRTLPEFSSFQQMLDLGGGPGLTGIAIVSSHPAMQGVIFDFPAVIPAAEKNIKAYKMTERMTAMGGNFRHDSVGSGYDLVWAGGTLNFAKEDLQKIVQKIHNAMNPKGIFVSFHEGFSHEGTAPEQSVLGKMSTNLMGYDYGLDQGVIAHAMTCVGFASVCSRTLNTPMGPIDVDIARMPL